MSDDDDSFRYDATARSFRPSDFGLRDIPRIVTGLLGIVLGFPGLFMLLNGDEHWRWTLGVGGPCLIVSLILGFLEARPRPAKPEPERERS